MWVLLITIKDRRVISLIHKYLKVGVVIRHTFKQICIGIAQGGQYNIMLNELDKELKSRGHRFVRYVYDIMIFCISKKCTKLTLEKILPFI